MPTLTLDKLWVNLIATGEAVSAQSTNRNEDFKAIGEVKHLAGGRQRGVHVVGEQGEYSVTLVEIDRSTVDTLRDWKGHDVLVRDDRGRSITGVFFQVTPSEVFDRKTFYNVAISVRAVDTPEGV